MWGVVAAGAAEYMRHQKAKKERARELREWAEARERTKPSAERVAALKQQGLGELAMARKGSYGNLYDEAAARGFGQGSGIVGGAAQGIEGQYLRGLADYLSRLYTWAETPEKWEYPIIGRSTYDWSKPASAFMYENSKRKYGQSGYSSPDSGPETDMGSDYYGVNTPRS